MADINTHRNVRHLSISFADAISSISGPNTKGTDLYNYQVEFCYLINDIQQCPPYVVPKLTSKVYDLIENIKGVIR